MSYLIDGHNLIAKIPGHSLRAADDEERLIVLLQEFCRLRRKQAEVFFDGAPPGQAGRRKFGAVSAHFVPLGATADSTIAARLQQLKRNAKNYTVVSSDRQVQAAARAVRAETIASEVFVLELLTSAPPPAAGEKPKLNPGELEEWLELFTTRARPRS